MDSVRVGLLLTYTRAEPDTHFLHHSVALDFPWYSRVMQFRLVGVGSVLGVVSTLAAIGCENFVAGSIDGAVDDDVVVQQPDASGPSDSGVVGQPPDAGIGEDGGPTDTVPGNCTGRTPVPNFFLLTKDTMGIGVQPTIANDVLVTGLTSKVGTGFSTGVFDLPSRNTLLRFEFKAQRGADGSAPPSGIGYKIAELLGGGANNISLGIRSGGWAVAQYRSSADLLSVGRDPSLDTNWHTASIHLQPSLEAGSGHLVTVRIDNGPVLTLNAATLVGSALQVQLGAYYYTNSVEPESRVNYRNVRYWTCM